MKKGILTLGIVAWLVVPAGLFAQRNAGQAEQAAQEAAKEVQKGVERAAAQAEEAARQAQLGQDNLPSPLYRVRRMIGSAIADSQERAAGAVEDAILSAPSAPAGAPALLQVVARLDGLPELPPGRYLIPAGRLTLKGQKFTLPAAGYRQDLVALPEGQDLQARFGPQAVPASKLLDDAVVGSDGKEVGQIDDVVVDLQTGRVAYAVLGAGGVIGFGEKRIALPYGDVRYDPGQGQARVDATAAQVQDIPGFPRDRWPAGADESWKGQAGSAGGTQPSPTPRPTPQP